MPETDLLLANPSGMTTMVQEIRIRSQTNQPASQPTDPQTHRHTQPPQMQYTRQCLPGMSQATQSASALKAAACATLNDTGTSCATYHANTWLGGLLGWNPRKYDSYICHISVIIVPRRVLVKSKLLNKFWVGKHVTKLFCLFWRFAFVPQGFPR